MLFFVSKCMNCSVIDSGNLRYSDGEFDSALPVNGEMDALSAKKFMKITRRLRRLKFFGSSHL